MLSSDNQKQAKALMRKMEAHLPIPVRVTDELARTLEPHGLKLKRGQELSIKNLVYGRDVGGITCDVTLPEANSVVLCSLTQVEINPDHPLLEEIQTYQRARKKGISQKGRQAGSAFIKPSEKDEPREKKRRRRRKRRH